MKLRLWFAALGLAAAFGAAGIEPTLGDQGPATIGPPDEAGTCAVHGTLQPGEAVSLLCALDHAESTALLANVETGSLYVQGWVLRTTGGYALVGLRNVSTTTVSLHVARVTLLRAGPATLRRAPQPSYDTCVRLAIEQARDASVCDAWKRTPDAPAGTGDE